MWLHVFVDDHVMPHAWLRVVPDYCSVPMTPLTLGRIKQLNEIVVANDLGGVYIALPGQWRRGSQWLADRIVAVVSHDAFWFQAPDNTLYSDASVRTQVVATTALSTINEHTATHLVAGSGSGFLFDRVVSDCGLIQNDIAHACQNFS